MALTGKPVVRPVFACSGAPGGAEVPSLPAPRRGVRVMVVISPVVLPRLAGGVFRPAVAAAPSGGASQGCLGGASSPRSQRHASPAALQTAGRQGVEGPEGLDASKLRTAHRLRSYGGVAQRGAGGSQEAGGAPGPGESSAWGCRPSRRQLRRRPSAAGWSTRREPAATVGPRKVDL